jgi:hypothetical protein
MVLKSIGESGSGDNRIANESMQVILVVFVQVWSGNSIGFIHVFMTMFWVIKVCMAYST